jgi:mRNA interferase RelE/StbE
MSWTIKFLGPAAKAFDALENNQARKVAKAIKNKLMVDPKNYGDALGNKGGRNLTGFYSLRVDERSLRIIYVVYEGVVEVVLITVIEDRAGFEAHDSAVRVLKRFGELLDLLQKVSKIDATEFHEHISKVAKDL